MNYGEKEWATMFRVSKLYLRALRRKNHEKNAQDYNRPRLNHKILTASRFTPFYHF
tara:strand:+ start:65 stop:232 length:168 start_codon:yes stop_codon:yes gene_type:complete